jgi:hypothetical protein
MKKVEVKAFWDKEQEIKTVVKADGKSAIKVKLTEKDGVRFIDVRKYVTRKGDTAGFNQHTTSGISLELTTPDQLAEVIYALTVAGEQAFAPKKATAVPTTAKQKTKEKAKAKAKEKAPKAAGAEEVRVW